MLKVVLFGALVAFGKSEHVYSGSNVLRESASVSDEDPQAACSAARIRIPSITGIEITSIEASIV